MIDLHSHTTASDGQYTAQELFTRARAAGVTALAVTDHDTVNGLEAAAQAARLAGVVLVPGIEITTIVNRREVHILGHFVDAAEARLAGFGDRLRIEREKRMELMVAKMVGLGFPVSMEHVRAVAGDGHLTRPHLARVLVNQGWCLSVKEVFDRFLADGGPASVERFVVTVAEAVQLIHGAGGTATLAHPGVSKVSRYELDGFVRDGLDGLEALHSDHPESQREQFLTWARELDLVGTAGSDFHGELVAPARKLGTASTPEPSFERLRAKRR